MPPPPKSQDHNLMESMRLCLVYLFGVDKVEGGRDRKGEGVATEQPTMHHSSTACE
jgi:hypothetical protein